LTRSRESLRFLISLKAAPPRARYVVGNPHENYAMNTTSAAAPKSHSVRWLQGVALWVLILAGASVIGFLQALYLKPWLGEPTAAQISFAATNLLILCVAYVFAPWLRANTTRAQLKIGALWLALTMTFEFESLLAHLLDLPPDPFFADHLVTGGGFMLGLTVLLLVVLFAPMAGARLRGYRGRPN